MSKEKQIEEMAMTMVDSDNIEVTNAFSMLFVKFAEALYNAGYRQQSGGEWLVKWRSTFPQYEPSEYECSNCGYRRTVLHKYCPKCGAKMKEV